MLYVFRDNFYCFVTLVVDGLQRSESSDYFASLWSHWTRPLTPDVKWISLHLLLHLHLRRSCLFVFYSLTSLSVLTSYTNTTHPYFPPWLRSCSFIPRGEEQTPIITQVSVKWIIGRLIELHDGKHPSWVVRLSVLRPLPHLSADAQGWHVCILIATAERERVWSATAACCARIPDSWQGNLVIMNALT